MGLFTYISFLAHFDVCIHGAKQCCLNKWLEAHRCSHDISVWKFATTNRILKPLVDLDDLAQEICRQAIAKKNPVPWQKLFAESHLVGANRPWGMSAHHCICFGVAQLENFMWKGNLTTENFTITIPFVHWKKECEISFHRLDSVLQASLQTLCL